MKKFAVFSILCGLFISPVMADDGSNAEIFNFFQLRQNASAEATNQVEQQKGCGLNQMTLFGTQYPDHDEFLFDSMTAYNSAPQHNGTYAVSGTVWECDNEYCGHNVQIQMEPGHVFEGVEINEQRTYTCMTGGLRQSHWVYETEEKMCGETHISYDGNQAPADNEFLYTNKSAWDSVRNRADGGTVAGGLVYECDNDHCTHNHIQEMPAGHYFKGQRVDEAAKYRCVAEEWNTIDDRWERIYEGCQYRGQQISVGNWYVDNSGNKIVLNFGECSQFQDMNPSDANQSFNAKCENVGGENKMRCYPVDGTGTPVKPGACPSGSSDKITNKSACGANQTFKCVKVQNEQCLCGKCEANGNGDGNNGGGDNGLNKCLAQRTTTEGKACCYLPGEVAEWTGKECKCLADGMNFVERGGRGYCEAKPADPTKPFECDASMLAVIDGWALQCKDDAGIMALINQIRELCKSATKTQVAFNSLWTALLAMQPQNCTVVSPVQTTIDISVNIRSVQTAYSKLKSIHDKFRGDVSVWKSADGTFNTARLASDSIAGVVLGTAGGLITSNVVKKNQIEDGFEDIQCTIGGQSVANWGDEFRVGIQ